MSRETLLRILKSPASTLDDALYWRQLSGAACEAADVIERYQRALIEIAEGPASPSRNVALKALQAAK